MFSSVEINNTLGTPEFSQKFQIKEKVEDFIVQEVTNGFKCQIYPLFDLEKFYRAESILNNLPQNEISKEERREIYSIINYHPFLRAYTQNSKFQVEKNTEDVFVFTLMKYDYSFNSLINLLSNRLGVSHNCIQTGGTKDKRGITLQEISVKCSFETLFNYALSLSKNENLKIRSLGYNESIDEANEKIKNEIAKYMKIETVDSLDPLMIFNIKRGNSKKLGDLDGNIFTIKIRNLFNFKLNQVKFLNYFGPQRFGVNLNNHEIGKCILDENYDEALEMILADGPNYNSVQKMIIKLKEQKNKSKFIVNRIPRYALMIYLHAYQSYIFNKSINERLNNRVPLKGVDKILKDSAFEDVDGTESLEDIYIPLVKMEHKFLKGGYRKMIEEMKDISFNEDQEGTVISFYLNKSCYATIALRELIGDFDSASVE